MHEQLNQVGQKYHDFEVTKVVDLPEIHCQLVELTHLPTGAKIMHIENDDPENVFCLSFQTVPYNDNGVAHILEHVVLCGSKKFPVKDPFFAMTRRSLNTFMNAFTGSDFTCYPAASQIPKDFYNLLDVYLDAVFHPNLNELSFIQEGHRLEFTNPSDPKSPLEYKGIVFNEMKGAMATPDSRLDQATHSNLFPNITYGYNSGGAPEKIPDLSYEELKEFHRKFYHPSRCLFFFYGNMPIQPHLDFITERTLKGVKKVDPLPPLPPQPRFKKPRSATVPYPLPLEEDPAEKALISFSWLTCHILEQEDILALSVLSIILIGTDAAPLKKAFLRSGLCKNASLHIDSDCSEVPISIILRGCDPENKDKLEQILKSTLLQLIEEGIPHRLVENAIHQVEFHRSEIGGNHHPYGLSLFMRAGLIKQHGGNPEHNLKIHSLCHALTEKIEADPNYLSLIIRKYFLDNPHFVAVTAIPDTELSTQETVMEQKKLEEINRHLSPKQRQAIVKQAQLLEDFQEKQSQVDVDVLPKVTLEDVPKNARNFPLTEEKIGSLRTFHHNFFTNEIIYSDLIFPLPEIHEEELPWLRLFSLMLPQVGCGGRSYVENLEYVQAYTGGTGSVQTIFIHAEDQQNFKPGFLIHGKALHRNAQKLFALMQDMITSPDFTDLTRIKEIITKNFSLLQSSLAPQALKYAIHLSASGLGVPYRLSQAWTGLEYYWFMKDLVSNLDGKMEEISQQLISLQNRILGLEEAHLILTCDHTMYQNLKNNRFFGLQNLKTKPNTNPWKNNFKIPLVSSQGRVIASPVAFTCTTFGTLPYNHPDTPALSIAAHLFDNLILHARIREQGGAYGSGATNHTLSGYFCFYSYRDPNINSSLDAFSEAVTRIANGEFKDSDLEEAKLEIIQGFDSPIAPGSRGHVAYAWLQEGKTLEVRQKFRDRLLAATHEDIIKAVKKHIASQYKKGATVVFAGRELLEKENDIFEMLGKAPLPIEQI